MRLIDNLIITQDGIRDNEPIDQMVSFVKSGGFFTQEAIRAFGGRDQKLIVISQLPDRQDYIHNGHHRVLAIYLGGREYIRADEYVLEPRTYEEYLTPNPTKGFVTPFDPRKHMRLADFSEFKEEALAAPSLDHFISMNAHRYRVPRIDTHIHHLAKSLLA